MKIVVETIPHVRQRYSTCGDYWIDSEGNWQIRISSLGSPMFEALVAVHELVEMLLCTRKGVTMEAIDRFDLAYAADAELGEPGDCISAPYYVEHQIATGIERILAAELGVDWNKYENSINKLE